MIDKNYKNYKDYKGYKSLPFFIQSEIIYDFTVDFVKHYIELKSRTRDQMEQAARLARRLRSTSRVRIVPKRQVVSLGGSGKHPVEHLLSPEAYVLASQERVYGAGNIAEGYLQKSLEGRIKLMGVARGSLEELLNDYLDFLRQRSLPLWSKDSEKAKAVRALAYNRYNSYKYYKSYISSPQSAANAMICLINQTNRLLDQKLRWMEEEFVEKGGFRENLFRKRLERRSRA